MCLSAILTDSVFNSEKHYYPQAPLEEFQYKIKEREIKLLIVNDIGSFSDEDSDSNDDSSNQKYHTYSPPFVDDSHHLFDSLPFGLREIIFN